MIRPPQILTVVLTITAAALCSCEQDQEEIYPKYTLAVYPCAPGDCSQAGGTPIALASRGDTIWFSAREGGDPTPQAPITVRAACARAFEVRDQMGLVAFVPDPETCPGATESLSTLRFVRSERWVVPAALPPGGYGVLSVVLVSPLVSISTSLDIQ
jgi:hypothetical protein